MVVVVVEWIGFIRVEGVVVIVGFDGDIFAIASFSPISLALASLPEPNTEHEKAKDDEKAEHRGDDNFDEIIGI